MQNKTNLVGGMMLVGFVLFFFTMKALGLYTVVEFRIFNILIHGTFAYLAMRSYRQVSDMNFSYLRTFWEGVNTSIAPVLGFALFQFVYLQFLNPEFMLQIKETALLGQMLTPFRASLFLVMEGLGITIFTSYMGMRLLSAQEKVPAIS